MPTFLMISRHSPEDYPMNNEKMKKMTLEVLAKVGELTNNHGVKIIKVSIALTDRD